MTHLLGFLLSVVILKLSMSLLNMEASSYFDDVALILVVGGTACAAIITYPIKDLLRMIRAFVRIAKKVPEEKEQTVKALVDLAQAVHQSPSALAKAAKDKSLNPFLRDGFELMLSGFSRAELEDIMTERLYRDREREEAFGVLLRTISKYPPAFGLIGTVLGLVNVMRSVSTGADAGEIGLKMGLALVATFYGLILSNFVLVPMSENLFNKSAINLGNRELLLEGLLMIHDKKSPVVVQEKLNSYLPPLKRKDFLGVLGRAA